jgi:hypothetical protein
VSVNVLGLSMLSGIMISHFILSVKTTSTIKLSDMLSYLKLSVSMLSVIILNVVAPLTCHCEGVEQLEALSFNYIFCKIN